jgi:hypothetical protein
MICTYIYTVYKREHGLLIELHGRCFWHAAVFIFEKTVLYVWAVGEKGVGLGKG